MLDLGLRASGFRVWGCAFWKQTSSSIWEMDDILNVIKHWPCGQHTRPGRIYTIRIKWVSKSCVYKQYIYICIYIYIYGYIYIYTLVCKTCPPKPGRCSTPNVAHQLILIRDKNPAPPLANMQIRVVTYLNKG